LYIIIKFLIKLPVLGIFWKKDLAGCFPVWVKVHVKYFGSICNYSMQKMPEGWFILWAN